MPLVRRSAPRSSRGAPILGTTNADAAPAPRVDARDYLSTFTSTFDGTVQPYLLFVPDSVKAPGAKPQPLAVVLHGKGVDHGAWFKLTPILEAAAKHGYIVAAPYGRGDRFYRGPGEQDVLDAMADVRQHLAINPDRVYLVDTRWVAGVRGGLDSETPICLPASARCPGSPRQTCFPTLETSAPFVIHDFEDPIVDVRRSHRPCEILAGLGISFQYREEIGYGHGSRMIGDNLDRVFAWFAAHPRPKAAPGKTFPPARARRWFGGTTNGRRTRTLDCTSGWRAY